MSENLKHVEQDDDFHKCLEDAGRRLVVVDFYADWCGHCQTMGPVFEQLAPKYPMAVFLKVNVDDCTETAVSLEVKCLPSFFFFVDGKRVDNYCGGDAKILDARIKKWYKKNTDNHVLMMSDKELSLRSFIDLGKCDCVNQSQEHAFKNALIGDGYLESNSSSKLMMTIAFSESVNVKSLRIHAPANTGPKTLKLYVDQQKIVEFEDAEEVESSQTLKLTMQDLEGTNYIQLSSPQFDGVSSLTIYVTENQTLSNKTQIDSLTFFGSQVKYVTDEDG